MTRGRTIILILLQVLVVFAGGCGKGDDVSGAGGGGGLVNPLHPGGKVVLTVATCNVLKPEGRRDEMSMGKLLVRQALGKSVKNTNADIIGFNELDETLVPAGKYSLVNSCSSMSDMTWKLEWPNAPHENNTTTYSYANGFAYNNTKLQLEESGYVWLSKEEETWYVKPSSAYKKAGSPARTCVWAKFTHLDTGKVFWLFVTHLPTDSQGGAYNMAGVLNSFAAQKAGSDPAILTGDMNCSPAMSSVSATAAYRRLISYWTDGNKDATYGTMSGSSANYYYTVDTYSNDHPERRIDHIMTRGCSIKGYHTIVYTYSYDEKVWCPSDHLPLAATIEF
ncbi:MAG: endonuclease/exonuclease/phosphatase family protein [Bacteroidales bacterium]|nr:endonuclease/exonuclease/phosphatase family protein [Bacteroidales bacterium]